MGLVGCLLLDSSGSEGVFACLVQRRGNHMASGDLGSFDVQQNNEVQAGEFFVHENLAIFSYI